MRLEQCKHCQADLHVCRLCRFYNPHISDKCDHELAEPARDVTVANFCDYFQPRPQAYCHDEQAKSDAALDKLKSLFGDSDTSTTDQPSAQESARDKFDALFKDDD